MSFNQTFEKYGNKFRAKASALDVEFYCIKKNGRWVNGEGKECGNGLLFHYLEAKKLLWPERYRHRWTDLMYQNFIENEVTILMGAGSTQKTSHAAEFALIDYWCHPDNTLVLLSTTTVDKLEAGIFGEIKMLFKEARKIYPNLAGHLLDHKHAITTDNLEEDEIREMRKGILGRACYVGTQWVGLGVYAGIKQERIVFVADELQFMTATFLECLPNMFQNPSVRVIGSGNPRHDPDDQLGIAAEPLNGWNSIGEPEKTTVWKLRGFKGNCVNLVGTDSPNFDVPEDEPIPFPRLINRKTVKRVEDRWGKNSPQFYSQCKGVMKIGMAHSRVITREICRQHNAHDEVVWASLKRTRIYAVDPAYGGDDRCIRGWIEFGRDNKGVTILRVNPPTSILIDLSKGVEPEDQIAETVFRDLSNLEIPPEHAFYDAFGKGTIGGALARKFGKSCPIAVDSGARPTQRPVRHDLFTVDPLKKMKRLVRCDEHYQKFVTEMWFSVRYTIESGQMRELPEDVMLEGCMREYYPVSGNKIEVEPKKDMKERLGRSPDLFDWLAIAVEGARQRGFQINRLGADVPVANDVNKLLDEMAYEWNKIEKRKQLTFSR